jgi:hypothetical protein
MLHRLGIKVFAGAGNAAPLTDFIPLFHRWIQQSLLDELLIDVGDYSHVPNGPGIVLVGLDGNYGVDETGGRRGLLYYLKRPLERSVEAQLEVACRRALNACRLLEQDEAAGGIRFATGELQFIANDRLEAPNTDETFAALEPLLRSLATRLFPGADVAFERETDPRERFAVTLKSPVPAPVEELLSRI